MSLMGTIQQRPGFGCGMASYPTIVVKLPSALEMLFYEARFMKNKRVFSSRFRKRTEIDRPRDSYFAVGKRIMKRKTLGSAV